VPLLEGRLGEGKNWQWMDHDQATPAKGVEFAGQFKQQPRLPQRAEYLTELEQDNPVPDAEMVSTTDPDAILAPRVGNSRNAYYDNYLIDTTSRVILE